MPDAPNAVADEIMKAFARDTGLTSDAPPRRYLWTDAFAVCNFLELYCRSEDDAYLDLARSLVDQVHHVLGRHREDDIRSRWISGLSESTGEKHPTRGGLRIGKERNERPPHEAYDPSREWDRDGQYFHYLTKWMHALHRIGQVTSEPTFHDWATELAQTAHEAFTYRPSPDGQLQMYWKMSIDLSRPLVGSMGQHDPLDGLITFRVLQKSTSGDALEAAVTDMATMCEGRSWTTDDPLGLGGLLTDAHRLVQLQLTCEADHEGLLGRLLNDAHLGLKSYANGSPLDRPSNHRLAFRELGLSIGLHAAEAAHRAMVEHPDAFTETTPADVEPVLEYAALSKDIEDFWTEGAHREADSWTAHQDINAVMLATSLMPDAYLRV